MIFFLFVAGSISRRMVILAIHCSMRDWLKLFDTPVFGNARMSRRQELKADFQAHRKIVTAFDSQNTWRHMLDEICLQFVMARDNELANRLLCRQSKHGRPPASLNLSAQI